METKAGEHKILLSLNPDLFTLDCVKIKMAFPFIWYQSRGRYIFWVSLGIVVLRGFKFGMRLISRLPHLYHHCNQRKIYRSGYQVSMRSWRVRNCSSLLDCIIGRSSQTKLWSRYMELMQHAYWTVGLFWYICLSWLISLLCFWFFQFPKFWMIICLSI